MLERLGRGLTFVAGSVVGGLALAFLIVALRPDLIRGPTQPASVAAAPSPHIETAPPELASYAAAVD
ncbi:MAG: hypothetical protein WCA14_05430, partial [Steroidobacteraceae bacterium]